MPTLNPTLSFPQPYNKIGDGPEGPEVYVMTQKFANRFPVGSILTAVKSLHQRYNDLLPTDFKLPLTLTAVYNRGKKTIIEFGEWVFLVSYGMSGHWETKKAKCAQLELNFGENIYYWVSTRSLPTCSIQIMKQPQLESELAKLGLDILHHHPSQEQVLQIFKGRKNICAFLMDQSNFSGIGNYIKAVVLYRCKINPHCTIDKLSDQQKWQLWTTAQQVAQEAIAAEGMGMRDYRNETGERVGVSFDITPYAMKLDRNKNQVLAETIAGRTTWWVPAIQK
jgi:formamidopyrimidine-DNA glycosylase